MSTAPIGAAPPYVPAGTASADSGGQSPTPAESWLTRSYGSTGLGPAIIGHRGATDVDGIEENSLEALQYAVEHGADGIELDIQFLGDGTPVVFHDAAIEDGGILWFDQDLSGLDASDLAANGGDHDLLTLESWLDAYASLPEPRPSVFAEFKSETFGQLSATEGQAAVDEAVSLLNAQVAPEQLVAASFGTDVLAALRAADPSLNLGLFADRSGDVSVFDQLDQLQADGIDVSFVQMNEDNLSVGDDGHGITADDAAGREDQVLDRLYGEGYAIVIGHTREEYLADPRVSAIISNDADSATELRDEHALDALKLPPGGPVRFF